MSKYSDMILNIVLREGCHPTAEQVFMEMKQQAPGIAQASVYNNLNSLERQGLIIRLPGVGGPDRFDWTRRHDHAFCVGCGELCDVEMRDITPDIEKSFGQPVISYVLRINYLCENCRKKADEKL